MPKYQHRLISLLSAMTENNEGPSSVSWIQIKADGPGRGIDAEGNTYYIPEPGQLRRQAEGPGRFVDKEGNIHYCFAPPILNKYKTNQHKKRYEVPREPTQEPEQP